MGNDESTLAVHNYHDGYVLEDEDDDANDNDGNEEQPLLLKER